MYALLVLFSTWGFRELISEPSGKPSFWFHQRVAEKRHILSHGSRMFYEGGHLGLCDLRTVDFISLGLTFLSFQMSARVSPWQSSRVIKLNDGHYTSFPTLLQSRPAASHICCYYSFDLTPIRDLPQIMAPGSLSPPAYRTQRCPVLLECPDSIMSSPHRNREGDQ